MVTGSPNDEIEPKSTKGLFMVDLQGLELSDEELLKIESAIQNAVLTALAEIDNTAGIGSSFNRPVLLGFRADLT